MDSQMASLNLIKAFQQADTVPQRRVVIGKRKKVLLQHLRSLLIPGFPQGLQPTVGHYGLRNFSLNERVFSNLTELRLISDNITEVCAESILRLHSLRHFSFFPYRDLKSRSADNAVLANLLDKMVNSMPALRSIHIFDSSRSSPQWSTQIETRSRIELLKIDIASTIRDADIERITEHMRELRCLRLNKSMMTDQGACCIAMLPHLVSLSLSGCVGVKDSGFVALSRLVNLRSLDVSNSQNFTDVGLRGGVLPLQQLQQLNLFDCSNLTSDAVADIALLAGLEVVDISFTCVSDDGLSGIATSLHNLQTLRLRSCRKITDAGFVCMASACAAVELLDVSCSAFLTDVSLFAIANMSSLQQLNIQQCIRVTDVGLRAIATSPTLKSLKLPHFFGSDHIGSPCLTKDGWDCVSHLVL